MTTLTKEAVEVCKQLLQKAANSKQEQKGQLADKKQSIELNESTIDTDLTENIDDMQAILSVWATGTITEDKIATVALPSEQEDDQFGEYQSADTEVETQSGSQTMISQGNNNEQGNNLIARKQQTIIPYFFQFLALLRRSWVKYPVLAQLVGQLVFSYLQTESLGVYIQMMPGVIENVMFDMIGFQLCPFMIRQLMISRWNPVTYQTCERTVMDYLTINQIERKRGAKEVIITFCDNIANNPDQCKEVSNQIASMVTQFPTNPSVLECFLKLQEMAVNRNDKTMLQVIKNLIQEYKLSSIPMKVAFLQAIQIVMQKEPLETVSITQQEGIQKITDLKKSNNGELKSNNGELKKYTEYLKQSIQYLKNSSYQIVKVLLTGFSVHPNADCLHVQTVKVIKNMLTQHSQPCSLMRVIAQQFLEGIQYRRIYRVHMMSVVQQMRSYWLEKHSDDNQNEEGSNGSDQNNNHQDYKKLSNSHLAHNMIEEWERITYLQRKTLGGYIPTKDKEGYQTYQTAVQYNYDTINLKYARFLSIQDGKSHYTNNVGQVGLISYGHKAAVYGLSNTSRNQNSSTKSMVKQLNIYKSDIQQAVDGNGNLILLEGIHSCKVQNEQIKEIKEKLEKQQLKKGTGLEVKQEGIKQQQQLRQRQYRQPLKLQNQLQKEYLDKGQLEKDQLEKESLEKELLYKLQSQQSLKTNTINLSNNISTNSLINDYLITDSQINMNRYKQYCHYWSVNYNQYTCDQLIANME